MKTELAVFMPEGADGYIARVDVPPARTITRDGRVFHFNVFATKRFRAWLLYTERESEGSPAEISRAESVLAEYLERESRERISRALTCGREHRLRGADATVGRTTSEH